MRTSAPEARLILLSAATAERRASAQSEIERLATDVEWPRLEAMLAARRLLPLLGTRICQMLSDAAPDVFSSAVERSLRDTRRHGQFLQLAGARIAETLASHGVVSLPLKGPALAEMIYGDPGYRVSSDIDVLVGARDLPAALAAARSLGYGAPSDPVGRDGLPLLHFTLSHEAQLLPDLELHWRVHWYEREFAADMLVGSQPGETGMLVPTPMDGFMSLLLFHARDGFIDLRLVADLIAWWELFEVELTGAALAAKLRRYPALERAIRAALRAVASVAGLPSGRLEPPRRVEARVRLAARLANPNPHQSVTQLHADMALVDLMLTPGGAHRESLARQILISREVLEYRAKRAQRDRPGSSIGHGTRVLARNALAIGRLVRGPR